MSTMSQELQARRKLPLKRLNGGNACRSPTFVATWPALLPEAPALILDVGAGSARDAAALAEMGHSVVAVESVDELRNFGSTRHRSSRIEWVDDSLPDLNVVRSMNLAFDAAMLTAVWMHLDTSERVLAMRHLSSLLLSGGHVLMTIRYGPVPSGRRMFEVTHEETVQLAADCGLRCVYSDTTGSIQESNPNQSVTWTRLAFRRNWSPLRYRSSTNKREFDAGYCLSFCRKSRFIVFRPYDFEPDYLPPSSLPERRE